MVIAHHFAVHGGFDFPINSITFNRLYYQFIFMGGSLGNDIFVLISGYFLVKSSGVKILKIFKFWQKVFFYSVVIFAVFVFSGLEKFSWKEAISYSLPIVTGKWWFASTYIVLYLIHPYVNILLRSFSQEEYKKFLTLIFFLWSIIPTFLPTEFGANALINFISLYSLAGYFRLWGTGLGERKFIFYGFLFLLINFFSAVCLDFIGLKNSYVATRVLHFYAMMRPFTVLSTLCFLRGFRSLNIGHNKIINTFAAATFGVYLIHDNGLVRPFLWFRVFKNASFQDSPYLILYSIMVVIIVFAACTLIEIIRSKIFSFFSRNLS